ncbi:DNA ligase-like domain-containing protein [Streptomyces olivaceoviridis]|uniref:hypothetical protein n=1 Tax=Streptomyces olivaceoviridis TaxID=1921 RepID=UPI0036CAC5F1
MSLSCRSSGHVWAAALAQLPQGTGLDGELVVWVAAGRLAFERLQNRLAGRGVELLRLAQRRPRHYPVFDLVHAGGDVTGWPYER